MKQRVGSGESGFAIIVATLLVAFSIFFTFGTAVVVQHSRLVEATAHAQRMEWVRTREDIKLDVQGSNVEIVNRGAQPSVIVAILTVKNDRLTVTSRRILLNAFGKETISGDLLSGESKIGVLTQLGNAFWYENPPL